MELRILPLWKTTILRNLLSSPRTPGTVLLGLRTLGYQHLLNTCCVSSGGHHCPPTRNWKTDWKSPWLRPQSPQVFSQHPVHNDSYIHWIPPALSLFSSQNSVFIFPRSLLSARLCSACHCGGHSRAAPRPHMIPVLMRVGEAGGAWSNKVGIRSYWQLRGMF